MASTLEIPATDRDTLDQPAIIVTPAEFAESGSDADFLANSGRIAAEELVDGIATSLAARFKLAVKRIVLGWFRRSGLTERDAPAEASTVHVVEGLVREYNPRITEAALAIVREGGGEFVDIELDQVVGAFAEEIEVGLSQKDPHEFPLHLKA